MSGTMVGSEPHPARAASNPAARHPAMRHRTTDRIDLFANTASTSVHGADHSVHDDFYGLALILVIDKAFAYAIVEGIREIAQQRGILEIA
jgi:hypothetical protein